MEDQKAIAWLGRKIGWGFAPGQFDDWMELGPEGVIDQLVEPDEHGIASRGDRFQDVDQSDRNSHRMGGLATVAWIENAVQSPRQLETFMEFFWSGFFSVSLRQVRPRILMLPYMDRLAELSFGNFENMLQVISNEPAMLDFLDGSFNTKRNPNENYARELLELYSVGVGNFTEDDVFAASRALTGWRLDREAGEAVFTPNDHDDTEQELLGGPVQNMEEVVRAAAEHEATAPRVVGLLADAILGHGHDTSVTESLVEDFASDMEIKPVVRSLLELGIQGHAVPSLLEPLGWYVTARRCPTRFPRESFLRRYFEQSGQLPLFPPNVGGYPDPDSYLSTSAMIARLNMATHLVERTAELDDGYDFEDSTEDLDSLALGMGLLDGFAPSTLKGLESLPPGGDRMAAALAAPDLLVV